MDEVLPSFNNIQSYILAYLECEYGCGFDEGKDYNSTCGHLLKLIERGYVQKLESGKFMLVYNFNGDALYECYYYRE